MARKKKSARSKSRRSGGRGAHLKALWAARKAAGKRGRIGKTWYDAAPPAAKSRKRKSKSAASKRSRSRKPRGAGAKAFWAARKAAGKHGRPGKTWYMPSPLAGSATRKTRMSAKVPKRKRGRRKASSGGSVRRLGPSAVTLRPLQSNPARRRRRGRRHYAHSRRRGRRSFRRYRRNPGGAMTSMLIELAKKAVPVLASFYTSRVVASKVGGMIPGMSSLGAAQQPVMAAITLLGAHFLTDKVGALAPHRGGIMMGAMINAINTVAQAILPPSVKSMVGLSDYVQMGDYLAVGDVPPINDSMTLSDYVAVGGVEEELGAEEELGVDEELGNDLLGGMPGGGQLLKQVPTQSFVKPIPARSFTKQIPEAGTSYDNPGQLYKGIFNGGFGS